MANLFLPQIITWFRLDEHVKRLKSILDSLIDRVTVLEETPVPVFTSPYKVYSALLTQSGTDAPVATVLENTLGGEVVWSRYSEGVYMGELSNTFIINKTDIAFGATKTSGQAGDKFEIYDDEGFTEDNIKISQLTYNNNAVDEFTQIRIEIRVYN